MHNRVNIEFWDIDILFLKALCKAMNGFNQSLTQLGNGLCSSIDMLAKAMCMSQQKPRPAPMNQNLFYSNLPQQNYQYHQESGSYTQWLNDNNN